ncbi:metallophosphoesterase [Stenotrophomonas bentonitica]|uniref:metallophosphoesterase family protein n=1 Tax=Stenotrophomonas bentonitica TaxID=1450134 RepID=UPI00345EF563
MGVLSINVAFAQGAGAADGPGVLYNGCERTLTQSYASYIQPGWASAPRTGQFVVASDPQYPRTILNSGVEGEDRALSEQRLSAVFDDISSFRKTSASYVPLLINGDLTEFGHGWQRSTTQTLFRRLAGTAKGPLMFPGLGNHDYRNNVDDCANNGCARDSICDVIRWYSEIHPTALQPASMDHYASEDLHRGSFGYSITYGPLHFIQLNDEPTYRREFGSDIIIPVDKVKFSIVPSLRWLQADLREARRKGLIIFVSLHKRVDWNKSLIFKELIESYGVSAVFAGHEHAQLGAYGTPEYYGNIPVFQSGALAYGSYLTVSYNADAGTATVFKVPPERSHTQKERVQDIALKAGTQLPAPIIFDDALTFFEGNSATEKAICDVPLDPQQFNMGGTHGCPNDEARSLMIMQASKGTVIHLYGNWNYNGDQGYAAITVTDDIVQPTLVGSFNRDYNGTQWNIRKYGPDTLDGKISSVRISRLNYDNGYVTLYEGNNQTENVVCTESVAYNRSYNMGGKCANDEAKSAIFHYVKRGVEVCYYGDWNNETGQGYMCIATFRDLDEIRIDSFDTAVDVPNSYWVFRGSRRIDGKISSTRVHFLGWGRDDGSGQQVSD